MSSPPMSGSNKPALEKHKQRMEAEKNEEKRSQLAQNIELWKRALTEVADLKGKNAKDRKETEFIKEVVTDIHRSLGVLLSNTMPCLIGMDRYITSISSWLIEESCHPADILTIAGVGGIGKTSLARYVIQLHCNSGKFHKRSFIEGINRRCDESVNGLLDLQKQLHGDISKKIPFIANDVFVYTSKIENVLSRKTVLLVLDDIGSLSQLDALLGNTRLHQGSKVIITTKDASLTERCELFDAQAQSKHTKILLDGLHKVESLELLCLHAFKSQKPKEGYEEASEELVMYCDGHPLALEVLGRTLHKKDVAYWEEHVRGIKKEPHFYIEKALQMGFDTLPLNDKALFKHIACFFVGVDRDLTEIILNACDINTRSGITNLTDRCLLSIKQNKLMMHQLIQEMGRHLVRLESPDRPWERSRLWCHEESFRVLELEKGTENILGLALDMRKLEKEKSSGSLQLKTEALSKMDNLQLIILNHVEMNGSNKNLSKELRWLCMHGFPLKSIHLDVPMENLVALDMSHSNIESFYISYSCSQRFAKRLKVLIGSSSKDKRLLGSLKILDLSFCEQLRYIGGFLDLPTLVRLIVKRCPSLIEVCESIEQCVELVHIDLSYCYKLKKAPISLAKLKKVKTLLLDGCNLRESQIKAIPSDLTFIGFSLPSSLRVLSLANNNLSNESFPRDFSCLPMLEELYLDENPIVSMPNCVTNHPRLHMLSMRGCYKMTSIEHPPPTLRVFLYDRDFNVDMPSQREIRLNPGMSTLELKGFQMFFPQLSSEFDDMMKIQVMEDLEEKVLYRLGWTDSEFVKERALSFYGFFGESTQTQVSF